MDDYSSNPSLETSRRGRRENNVRSEQITLTLSAGCRELLEELTDTGYFGKNAADTATMLLWEALQDAASKKAKEIESLKILGEYRSRALAQSKLQKVKQILEDS